MNAIWGSGFKSLLFWAYLGGFQPITYIPIASTVLNRIEMFLTPAMGDSWFSSHWLIMPCIVLPGPICTYVTALFLIACTHAMLILFNATLISIWWVLYLHGSYLSWRCRFVFDRLLGMGECVVVWLWEFCGSPVLHRWKIWECWLQVNKNTVCRL